MQLPGGSSQYPWLRPWPRARAGIRGRWLAMAAMAIWLGLVFGSYFAVSMRQIWPKVVSVLGG